MKPNEVIPLEEKLENCVRVSHKYLVGSNPWFFYQAVRANVVREWRKTNQLKVVVV